MNTFLNAKFNNLTFRFVLHLIVVLLCSFSSQSSYASSLEDRLSSTDPKISKAAVEELLKKSVIAEPLSLMSLATQLNKMDKKDDAVFWFYAGQLRARYSPKLTGENSQLIAIMTMVSGPIKAYGQRNINEMDKTIKRVLDWDAKSFNDWALANNYNPADESMSLAREKSRQRLVALMVELNSNREQYEKIAREYVDPAEQLRLQKEQWQALVDKSYTENPIERVIDGKTLRFPANYETPIGLAEPSRKETQDITFAIFLPDFSGYPKHLTDEHFKQDGMLVRVNDHNEPKNAADKFEEAIATNPPIIKLLGSDAYSFDSSTNYKAVATLPLRVSFKVNVIRSTGVDGNPVYMGCDGVVPGIVSSSYKCVIFIQHRASGLHLNATFDQKYVDTWPAIINKLYAFMDVWYVAE